MNTWPQYRSHKIVRAMKIIGKTRDENGELIALYTQDWQAFQPTAGDMLRRAEYGDYAVVYEDGFKSVSPKAAFEGGYTEIDE